MVITLFLLLFFWLLIFLKQQRLRCSLSSLTDDYNTNSIRLPLWDKASAEFYFAKSRELLTKPFPKPRPPPQHNSCRDLHLDDVYPLENQFHDLSIRDIYYQNHSYLTKSENLTRKNYNQSNNRYDRNRILYDARPPPPSPFNRNGDFFTFDNYEQSYDNDLSYNYTRDNPFIDKITEDNRPRAMSFTTDNHEIVTTTKKPKSRSIRDRNRRRQSYNPRAYESSSSDSDCTSLGSADLDWRRRKRLGRLSNSNSSIRSELIGRCRMNPHYLKPDFNNGGKTLGRSPPPSNSILSGLSPTTVTRCQRQNDSTSSDSSL